MTKCQTTKCQTTNCRNSNCRHQNKDIDNFATLSNRTWPGLLNTKTNYLDISQHLRWAPKPCGGCQGGSKFSLLKKSLATNNFLIQH
jgi:hypothetical protein